MKISRAYSLIELSVVILIIGVLIAGISAGTDLLMRSRLKTARALTAGSDAAVIEDMLLWLDATAEGSMVNAAGSVKVQDADKVQTWNDVNPQVNPLLRFSFIQSGVDAKRPAYEDSGINGLPTLFFDAAADASSGNALSVSYSVTLYPSQFTIFIVMKPLEVLTTVDTALLYNVGDRIRVYYENTVVNREQAQFWTYNASTYTYVTSNANTVVHNRSYIIGLVLDATNQIIYGNGTQLISAANNGAIPPPSGSFVIGCSTTTAIIKCFDGYISEIIIYSRALLDRERKAVERYLGQKYGIKVS